MEWYIQLHRKLIEWEWYDEPKVFKVFIHCLLRANHKPANWRWINIDRWEFITSLEKLAQETKLSVQNIRTVIKKLKSTWELTSKWQASYTSAVRNLPSSKSLRPRKRRWSCPWSQLRYLFAKYGLKGFLQSEDLTMIGSQLWW